MTGVLTKIGIVCKVIEEILPEAAREILGVDASVGGRIEEIRLRSFGVCSLVVCGKSYPLRLRVSPSEMADILSRLCHDALYAYRDTITMGYITMEGGIRVGVGGKASYDGGRSVGVGEVSSLVFRIPSSECSFANELHLRWRELGAPGMLIASPPSGGKTTAERALARLIGSGPLLKRVVIVDERCEFDPEDYAGAHVDVLRGYKRSEGIEIAVRTMSAELIMVDEIFTDGDRDALLRAHGSGVTVIATAHARNADDLQKKAVIASLLSGGMFPMLAFIERESGSFNFRVEEYR